MNPNARTLVRLNPEPTPEILETIAPGCYVRVALPEGCAWVEVCEDRGEILRGRIQPQLHGEDCPWRGGEAVTVDFQRAQIVDLGCHHYCFC